MQQENGNDMEKKHCTLCFECELFKGNILIPEDITIMYKYHYCLNSQGRWKECKRFLTKNLFGFCPGFVMPNSLLSLDQIKQKVRVEYVA